MRCGSGTLTQSQNVTGSSSKSTSWSAEPTGRGPRSEAIFSRTRESCCWRYIKCACASEVSATIVAILFGPYTRSQPPGYAFVPRTKFLSQSMPHPHQQLRTEDHHDVGDIECLHDFVCKIRSPEPTLYACKRWASVSVNGRTRNWPRGKVVNSSKS